MKKWLLYQGSFRSLPFSAQLTNQYRIEDVLDKGRDSLLLVGVESKNEKGEMVFYNQASLFLKGDGGWGGERSSSHIVPIEKEPSREPDHVVEFR